MKQDQRRISKEEYEVDYVRSIARDVLTTPSWSMPLFSQKKIKRLARAVLKFAR